MGITSAHYVNLESTGIEAVIDGQTMFIPNNMANRNRQELFDWEEGGGVITPYATPLPNTEDVDIERDRRVEGGFDFNGNTFQSRPEDVANISGATTAATLAIISGAPPGYLRWANPAEDFVWLNTNNEPITFDAQTFAGLGMALLGHKSRLIFKGRDIKDRILAGEEIPDVTDDSLWL